MKGRKPSEVRVVADFLALSFSDAAPPSIGSGDRALAAHHKHQSRSRN